VPVQADGLRGFGQVIWGRVDKTVTMQFCHTSNVWQGNWGKIVGGV
jgi:hypothetical protein